MQFSGLIIDFYDQPKSMAELFVNPETAPDYIKTAMQLKQEELDALPDSSFALVMHNGAGSLRKFACVDEGNTRLHIDFFLKNAHKLPSEAIKTAASNLLTACEWYGIEPPEALSKIAIGPLGIAHLALMGPSIAKGTKQQIQQNMGAVNSMEGSGAVVPTGLMKGAELSGTDLMPNAPSDPLKEVASRRNTAINNSSPKTASLNPHVSAYNAFPEATVTEKKARHFALRGSVFPIDDLAQIKRANSYFEEYKAQLTPAERHEYCANLVKRAEGLNVGLSNDVLRYGSDKYALAYEIKAALDMRKQYLSDEGNMLISGLWEKRAELNPEVFCEALSRIDHNEAIEHLYDRHILDPVASTFGFEKKADEDSWLDGNDYATERQIKNFGLTGYSTLEASFGAEFADEFRKDPWSIFQSMPLAQKRMIARMSSDTSPTGKQHVA